MKVPVTGSYGMTGIARARAALRLRLVERVAQWTFDGQDCGDKLPVLWSKGISRFCDFKGSAQYWLAPTESVADERMFRESYAGARSLVWVRLSTQSRDGLAADLDLFVKEALPTIVSPFVLVTTDGDASVPSDLRPATVAALLQSPFLAAWYAQNCDAVGDPRLLPFPIGLDLHTPRPFTSPNRLVAALRRLREKRDRLEDQPRRVFCDLGLSLNSHDRAEAVETLAGCKHVTMLGHRVSQPAVWKRYSSHPFVLSARGDGVDCHRTWEALYLGSIVITKSSGLAPLYEGLPVVIVDDWAEVRDKGNLERWLEQYGPLTGRERIWSMLEPANMMAGIRERHLAQSGGQEGTRSVEDYHS